MKREFCSSVHSPPPSALLSLKSGTSGQPLPSSPKSYLPRLNLAFEFALLSYKSTLQPGFIWAGFFSEFIFTEPVGLSLYNFTEPNRKTAKLAKNTTFVNFLIM